MRRIIAVLFAVATVQGCGGEENQPPPRSRVDEQGRVVLTDAQRAALDLDTVTAEDGVLTESSLRIGTVVARPQEDALVVAPVTGRLADTMAELGSRVSEGDALAVLEPLVDTASRAGLEAQRRQLGGQVEGAEAQVEAKQADLSRITTLVATELATEAERAQAEAALRSERARAESLRLAGDELAQTMEGALTLRTPVSGSVALLATGTGSFVLQGAVIARIVQPGPRWIDVAVPPEDPVGDAYEVRGVPEGSVRLLQRGVVVGSDGTRRDRLEADPVAASHLLPGAKVPIDVLREFHGVLVPVEAVVRRGRENLVFVEEEGGRFAPRVVEVSARDGERAAVTAGLPAGARVVTRGSASLLGELEASSAGGTEEGR